MNLKDIKELIDILKDTDVSEFDLEKSGTKIRIKKGKDSPAMVMPGMVMDGKQFMQAASSQPIPMAGAGPVGGRPELSAGEAADNGIVVVTSPIVGTFYRSPSPDSPSYVEVGDVVKKGQVLCIIEAMKLMNEIESEVGGKIVKIIPDSAQPVEYAEPLFHIEPN